MNPALPGGAGGQSDGDRGPERGQYSASARAGYTFVPYDHLQQGRVEAPNPAALAVDVHLATLQLTGGLPSGTSLDLQLPVGQLTTRMLGAARTDRGMGDLELRVRQSLTALRPLARSRLGLTLGLVAPTGPYVAKSAAAQLPPEAEALTLGRGVVWGLAEADLRVAVTDQVAATAQLSARLPGGQTDDGYQWGPEARTTVGAQVRAASWLTVQVASDLQWRGGATEPDPFAGGRLDSANVGGWQWTAIPSASAAVPGGVTLTAGLRVPIVADVTGNQLVPGPGGVVAVSYAPAFARSSRRPARAAAAGTSPGGSAGPRPAAGATAPVPGSITVIDYWATWCGPCGEIDVRLRAAAPGWPDVVIKRVDLTAADDLASALPAPAAGLPVIELFDARGQRAALLVGADALGVVDVVERLRAASPAPREETP
ncbi:MAG: thioredoxin domain-containing protein [Kofleriaceae bacterium]